MQLQIARPTEKKLINIIWIDLQTPVGSFVIQPEHAPMIVALKPDSFVTFGLDSGKQESVAVKQGIAHITREAVTLLLNE